MKSQKSLFKKINSTIFLGILSLSLKSHAYFATLDTGDTLGANNYAVSLSPQFIMNRYDGTDLTFRFDAGIDDDQQVRAIVGTGKVDYQLGALYKYIPYPDTDKQPAIGFLAGGLLSRVQGSNEFSLRFHPLVSKKFQVQNIPFNAYASLPIGITNRDSGTTIPVQMAFGAEWKVPKNQQFAFMAELGFNVSNAFSYLSLAGVFYFDDQNIHLEKRKSKEN